MKKPITIVVLSDTHIPRVAGDMPAIVYDSIRDADLVLHAGDITEAPFFQNLGKLKKTVAVFGNMDSEELKSTLNEKEIVSVGKFKIGLIHGTGSTQNLDETVRNHFKNVDVIVYGHSHAPVNFVKNKILFFNPGSPTDKVFAAYNSFGILTITEEAIEGKIIKIESEA